MEFTTEGRKIPLTQIRQKMLQIHKPFLRASHTEYYDNLQEEAMKERLEELYELVNTISTKDEMKKKLMEIETTRHLMVWLDNSTVANHGYLVCLVTCLYDPAVFLTNAEYEIKSGQKISVQSIIETPEVHFIARCGSSDGEQLMYIETRCECIRELKQPLMLDGGIEFTDCLRFCHGDSPLRAFEAGQQKGGNYFCSTCGVHFSMTYDLDHALNCQVLSFQDRQEKVLSGSVARRKSLRQIAKPFKGLKKNEIEEELASRKIFEGNTKKKMEELLAEEMCGIQRVPALLFNSPQSSLESLALNKYEILPAEPLHDVGHHIENVLSELTNHLESEEAKILKDAIDLCMGNKDSKRTVDYRIALIKTTGYAHQSDKVSQQTLDLLDSLVEIQRILYLPDDERCQSTILRYYNQVWYHTILFKEIIALPKGITLRKLYGTYFHNLSSHAGLMLRIISGQASHAEDQERIFNNLKRITKTTSNYHQGQIIPNMLIRLQAEKEMGNSNNYVASQQSHVTKLARCLPPSTNTRIPLSLVKKYSREWQAHLQQIGNYNNIY